MCMISLRINGRKFIKSSLRMALLSLPMKISRRCAKVVVVSLGRPLSGWGCTINMHAPMRNADDFHIARRLFRSIDHLFQNFVLTLVFGDEYLRGAGQDTRVN